MKAGGSMLKYRDESNAYRQLYLEHLNVYTCVRPRVISYHIGIPESPVMRTVIFSFQLFALWQLGSQCELLKNSMSLVPDERDVSTAGGTVAGSSRRVV